MKTNPYLAFNGNCAEAFKFYEKTIPGKIERLITAADTPMAAQTPPDQLDKVMHARMTVGGTVIMGGDAPPQFYTTPQGFSVSINVDKPEEADRIYKALSEGGKIMMPIAETFWAHRFAMFIDKFGTPWMINCEKTPE
jgi:PhnB protein